jgi:hypothetical protein
VREILSHTHTHTHTKHAHTYTDTHTYTHTRVRTHTRTLTYSEGLANTPSTVAITALVFGILLVCDAIVMQFGMVLKYGMAWCGHTMYLYTQGMEWMLGVSVVWNGVDWC